MMEKEEIIKGLEFMMNEIIRDAKLGNDVAQEDIKVLDAAIKEIKQSEGD